VIKAENDWQIGGFKWQISTNWHQVNKRSFCHASPRICNELPKELRQLVDDESLSLSSHLSLTGSSSPLSLCITPPLFHSGLKTYLFHKSFPVPTIVSLTFSDGSHGFL